MLECIIKADKILVNPKPGTQRIGRTSASERHTRRGFGGRERERPVVRAALDHVGPMALEVPKNLPLGARIVLRSTVHEPAASELSP